MIAASVFDPAPVHHRAVDFGGDELAAVLGDVVDLSRPVLYWWPG